MTSIATKRVPAEILDNDREVVHTIQTLVDYSPRNPAYATAELRQLVANLDMTEETEAIARRNYEVAREQAIKAGATLHTTLSGAKVEVMAQYGEDSPALHAVGRKQKSERKRPARRVSEAV